MRVPAGAGVAFNVIAGVTVAGYALHNNGHGDGCDEGGGVTMRPAARAASA